MSLIVEEAADQVVGKRVADLVRGCRAFRGEPLGDPVDRAHHGGVEPHLLVQTAAAGLTWKPEYSFKRAFWDDREALPPEQRKKALDAYLEEKVVSLAL